MKAMTSPSPPTKTLTLSLAVPQSLQVDEAGARELLVFALVESGRLSQSQGAEVLEISRFDLIERMGQSDIPVSRFEAGEHSEEQRSLRKLRSLRAHETPATGRKSGPQRSKPRP
ncbi:MAG: UPF0175 family protein [Chloroflexi bacterium]|nr:UPF0175 family protein [Chloroflexota bacterium]